MKTQVEWNKVICVNEYFFSFCVPLFAIPFDAVVLWMCYVEGKTRKITRQNYVKDKKNSFNIIATE